MTRATSLFAFLVLGCGEPVRLSVIPDEPDAGQPPDAASAPDAGQPPAPDLGLEPEPPCRPETHVPTPCRAGGCYGAVLCVRDELVCVAPDCEIDPEPNDCDLLDIVVLVDRSASMGPYMESVRAATSSLALGRGQRNLFLIDIPGLGDPLERPGPNRECYGTGSSFPVPPCDDPVAAADEFPRQMWGGLEYTWDALADLRHLVQWTPGAKRHAFLFADEPGQGEYFDQAGAVSRLVNLGVVVNVYVREYFDFEQIASATGGVAAELGTDVKDPCP